MSLLQWQLLDLAQHKLKYKMTIVKTTQWTNQKKDLWWCSMTHICTIRSCHFYIYTCMCTVWCWLYVVVIRLYTQYTFMLIYNTHCVYTIHYVWWVVIDVHQKHTMHTPPQLPALTFGWGRLTLYHPTPDLTLHVCVCMPKPHAQDVWQSQCLLVVITVCITNHHSQIVCIETEMKAPWLLI